MARALFTPWISPAIAMANLRAFVRSPLVYLGTIIELLAGTVRSPGFLARTIALFPKSVYLAERLEREGIRHVHAHYATHPATMAMIVARFAPSITYSFTAHAHDIFVNRAMLAPKLARAAGVRAISRFNRSFLAALYPAIAPEKIEVIRVGIQPETYRAPYEPEEPPLRILTVAALKPYKGIRVLIEACRILAGRGVDFVCEIVGDGPLRKALETQIARGGLGARVRLAGARPQGEVAAMMKGASLFVLPSVVAHDHQMEGIPVALMEAMAASRPVIATALSGVPELVEDCVTGLLVDANNPDLLAAAIRRAAGDLELRRRLGDAGRRAVEEKFDLSSNVASLVEWLDRMNPPADVDCPALREGAARVGVRGGVRTTPDSRVARAIVSGGSTAFAGDLVLKEHRARAGESAPPQVRAAREARVLRDLHARSSTEGLRLTVPEPVAASGTVVAMRVAEGTRLDDLIRMERRRPEGGARLEREIEGAASWLRWFHRQMGIGGSDGALVHGDYWPGNIFVSDDAITVVDFEGARPGDPLDDVAYFLVHAEIFFPPPFRRRFHALRERFLDAYFAGEVRPAAAIARAEAAAARALSRRLEARGVRAQIQRFVLARHRRPRLV
jgi:glycosyltransferase involved in cell wall biosynthesis/aminoglycoside phosphotransferase (APT) family kinase protein